MGFLDKMKQAKDMYGNMKKIQQELDRLNAAEVLVVVSYCCGEGNHHIKSITIDDSLKSPSSNRKSYC